MPTTNTPHQLDFIVFGPARSGTSAFSFAFNYHPDVFCASEYLPFKADHSAFSMPEDLLRPHLSDRHQRVRSRKELAKKLAASKVAAYGNKMPTYYFRLGHLDKQLPNLKKYFIYRSPTDFVFSWDKRAANQADKWHPGMRGIFGAVEQIFCLKRLTSLFRPSQMVSYEHLFYRDTRLMRSVIETLQVDTERFDQTAFEDKLFSSTIPMKISSPFYDAFFSEFQFELTDHFFRNHSLKQSNDLDFIRRVDEQLAAFPPPSRFASFVRELGPDAIAFADIWRKQCKARADSLSNPTCCWMHDYAANVAKETASRPSQSLSA